MDESQKRSHVATGDTPHKPADKESREEIITSSHSPARRTLGFGERASPLQKVYIIFSLRGACMYCQLNF